MNKKLLFIFILVFIIFPLSKAEQYKIVRGLIYYKANKIDTTEIRVTTGQTIPSENVFIRMDEDCNDNETFVIEDSKRKYYTCIAPKSWSNETLSTSIHKAKQKNDAADVGSTAIPMGTLTDVPITINTTSTRIKNSINTSKLHTLCVFVSEYDYSWHSLPFKDSDKKNMQSAINTIRSQDVYINGKNYLLTNPQTNKQNIVNGLDSILDNANENDLVILYLSGHGEKDADGNFHLIVKDTYRDLEGHYKNSITKTDINGYVYQLIAKKAKVLLFVDACYAGAILDNNMHGDAAYYLSTNGENAAYYNQLIGSPFAIALMETMNGSLNESYIYCFKDSMVQVGSLANYLSNAVYDQNNKRQMPLVNMHGLPPAYRLWRLHGSQKKESVLIRRLERQADNKNLSPNERAKLMLELGDVYYTGSGTDVNFETAFDWYDKAENLSTDKEIKAHALYKLSECLHNGKPIQDSLYAFKYALQAARYKHINAQYKVGQYYLEGYGTKHNEHKGFLWIKKAAQKGNLDAQFKLGLCYYNGNGIEKDYSKAAEWWTKAAENGDSDAQYNLGVCYDKGIGRKQNDSIAFFWFSKSSGQGNASAQYNVGNYYYEKQDYSTAIKYWLQSAGQGNVDAIYNLGVNAYMGTGAEKNYKEAVYWFRIAAEKGETNAQLALGLCYYNGNGIDQDYVKAAEWWTKAAYAGKPEAQNNIGALYLNGQGVSESNEKAFKWFSKAAEAGFVDAYCNLARCYNEGYGVEQNHTTALQWWKKAAENGNINAVQKMGWHYATGNGVEKDMNIAINLWEKAAALGDEDAQFNLGQCYNDGMGLEKDFGKAYNWFMKAAEQGYDEAQYEIARFYALGKGIDKDSTLAVEWYTKAAIQGHSRAQYHLGHCYDDGVGVGQDSKQAVRWWEEAAKQGHMDAQTWLGMSYFYGVGTKQDSAQAVHWWKEAAKQGHASAQNWLGVYYYSCHDYTKAVEWWTKAAKKGKRIAQASLGRCYLRGEGVKSDLEKAVELFSMAAEDGYDMAQFELGICYYNGFGVEKNIPIAFEWIKKAAEQGNKKAIKFLKNHAQEEKELK